MPIKLEDALASPTFCFYPFIQMSTVPAGFMKPCCYFEDVIRDEGDVKMRVDRHDYKAMWNSDSMKEIRMKMARGEKVAGCTQCYREEASGDTSMRLRSIREWAEKPHIMELLDNTLKDSGKTNHLPKILELKPGNLCNLKCRMCNKFDSNQIGLELVEISKYRPEINPKDYDRIKSHLIFDQDFDVDDMTEWSKADSFWKNVRENVASLERLGFAGGESSLMKEVNETLRYCVDSGHAEHINVFYTTNLTRVNSETIELAKKFRTFTWIVSIDGFGATQEYIRYPSKWKIIEENFIRIKSFVDADQWRVIANFTVQSYNICNITDFFDWIEKMDLQGPPFAYNPVSLNLLTNPDFLDIQFLPLEVRQHASRLIDAYWLRNKLTKFEGFTDRLRMVQSILHKAPTPGYQDRMADFLDFTRILDHHRKQDLAFINPFLFHSVFNAADINLKRAFRQIGFKLTRMYLKRPADRIKGRLRHLASIIKFK